MHVLRLIELLLFVVYGGSCSSLKIIINSARRYVLNKDLFIDSNTVCEL